MKWANGRVPCEQKLEDANQEKRLQNWKETLKNLLENPLNITDKPNEKVIDSPLDIKQEQFMEVELEAVQKENQKLKI